MVKLVWLDTCKEGHLISDTQVLEKACCVSKILSEGLETCLWYLPYVAYSRPEKKHILHTCIPMSVECMEDVMTL